MLFARIFCSCRVAKEWPPAEAEAEEEGGGEEEEE